MKKIYLQIILVLNLFFVVIWFYPRMVDFLIDYNRHYSIPSENGEIDRIAERGTFGDMFGLLNTVFSGIALLGVVYTLYDERQRVKDEKRDAKINKLIFLEGFIKLSLDILESEIVRMELFIEKYSGENILEHETFVFSETNFKRFERILESLNEEEYYLAFVEFRPSEESINTFDTLNNIISTVRRLESETYKSRDNFSKNELAGKINEILILIDKDDLSFWLEYRDIFKTYQDNTTTDIVNFALLFLSKLQTRESDESIIKSESETAILKIYKKLQTYIEAFKSYHLIKQEFSEINLKVLKIMKAELVFFQSILNTVISENRI